MQFHQKPNIQGIQKHVDSRLMCLLCRNQRMWVFVCGGGLGEDTLLRSRVAITCARRPGACETDSQVSKVLRLVTQKGDANGLPYGRSLYDAQSLPCCSVSS